jgi:hypothetical protein
MALKFIISAAIGPASSWSISSSWLATNTALYSLRIAAHAARLTHSIARPMLAGTASAQRARIAETVASESHGRTTAPSLRQMTNFPFLLRTTCGAF